MILQGITITKNKKLGDTSKTIINCLTKVFKKVDDSKDEYIEQTINDKNNPTKINIEYIEN